MTISRARLLFLTLTSAFSCPLSAQYPGVQSTVERQIQTLEQKKTYAEGLIAEADAKIKESDFAFAYARYKSAIDILPRGGSAVDPTRQSALDGFCGAAVKLANLHLSQGRYDDALAVVEVVLEERYNPNYEPALSLRKDILKPQAFADKGTLTPNQVYRIDEVKKLLVDAEELFRMGRYDLSFKRCEQVLNIDKNNIAARRFMEKIISERKN